VCRCGLMPHDASHHTTHLPSSSYHLCALSTLSSSFVFLPYIPVYLLFSLHYLYHLHIHNNQHNTAHTGEQLWCILSYPCFLFLFPFPSTSSIEATRATTTSATTFSMSEEYDVVIVEHSLEANRGAPVRLVHCTNAKISGKFPDNQERTRNVSSVKLILDAFGKEGYSLVAQSTSLYSTTERHIFWTQYTFRKG